jgi:hypothetical protein
MGTDDPPPPAYIRTEAEPTATKFVDECNTAVWIRYRSTGQIEVLGSFPSARSWPSKVDIYKPIITQMATRYVIPEAWIAAFIAQESGGKEQAVSSSGAAGLMQLMPGTAKWLSDPKFPGQTPDHVGPTTNELFDPLLNIELGTKFLEYLYSKHGGNIMRMAAEYSHGSAECGDEIGWRDPTTGIRKACAKDEVDFGYITHCGYIDGIIAYVNRAVAGEFSGLREIDLNNEVATTEAEQASGSILGVAFGAALGMGAMWAWRKYLR